MNFLKYVACSLIIGLSGLNSANAKFTAINKNDPTDKYLLFVDFDNKKVLSMQPTHRILLNLKSNPVDALTKKSVDKAFPQRFKKVWFIGEVIVDCEKKTVTSQNMQIMGANLANQTVNISQTYQLGIDEPSTRSIKMDNAADTLVFNKVCTFK